MRATSMPSVHPLYLESEEKRAQESQFRLPPYAKFTMVGMMLAMMGLLVFSAYSYQKARTLEVKLHAVEHVIDERFSGYSEILTVVIRALKRHDNALAEASDGASGSLLTHELASTKSPAVEDGSVQVARASVRERPSPTSNVLLTLSKGTRLLILEQKGPWYKVELPNGN